MKMPQRPPSWLSLLTADPGQLRQLLGAKSGPVYNGRYYHWDKLRHLKPPGALTHEQWWATLKLARTSQTKLLPLHAVNGQQFSYTLPDPAIQLLHTLDRDAGGQILVTDQVANPETRNRYIVSSFMEEAITSSQIEGAATTRVVAKELLRTGRKPRDRGEQMIRNNYAAIQRIRALAREPLKPEVIFDLHRILTDKAIDTADAAGRLRRPDERVVVEDNYGEVLHAPPPAEELPERMQAMCDFANGRTAEPYVHPVVRAIALHFWLAYDHPFVDGNGRCARALFYWSMLRSEYWLCEFISISQFIRAAQARYGRAFLYTETDDNDLTYFLLYHLDLIRRAIDSLQEYLKRKMSEVREAERLLRDSDNLNHRQIALLSHAVRHPDASYTIASHQTSHNTVYETARTDLMDLQKLGLMEAKKRGKTYQFFPARDLQARMRNAR